MDSDRLKEFGPFIACIVDATGARPLAHLQDGALRRDVVTRPPVGAVGQIEMIPEAGREAVKHVRSAHGTRISSENASLPDGGHAPQDHGAWPRRGVRGTHEGAPPRRRRNRRWRYGGGRSSTNTLK